MKNSELLSHTTLDEEKLDALRASLAIGKFKDYPDNKDRLVTSSFEHDEHGRIILPDGPWCVDEKQISEERYAELQKRGLQFDSLGRPLHPLFEEMAADPDIGVLAGRGFFWEFGPNETADAVIIRRDFGDEPWVVLIQRSDNKQFAFPGGFLEGKTILETALAEPREEAFVDLDDIADSAILAYTGAVADIRTMANAWIQTNAVVFELPDTLAGVHTELIYPGGDDADWAFWAPWSYAEEIVQPAHKLIARAVNPLVTGRHHPA